MQASGNAGNFLQSPGQSSPNTIRKLRRMRKLRHATDDELGLSSTDRSSPSSGLTRKSRSSDHWSSFAVPIPLPLPESSVLRRPDSSGSNPGHSLQLPEEGLSSSLGRRKNSNHVTKISDKSSSHFLKGDSKDVNNRRSSPTRGFLSPAVSPQRSNTAGTELFSLPGPDSKSLSTRRRGFSHDLKVDHPLKLNVSPKSAPTSVLSSPAVSPQRSKPGDRFTSFWAPKEIQAWSTVEVLDSSRNCTSPVSPDRSHSPIDRAAQKVDFIPNSPGTPPPRDRKQPCNSETFRQCYTFNCATASHHSPCSTLGVNRSLPTGQLIHNSHNFSPSSNDSSNMALGAVNNHPCALSRTHGREVPHI
ncbi:hypothetical protein Pint_08857 [Pistacia integerrima]|uniref:Uncharacterized protein n=1 Tax=Pistacia integerrima TaxID=434235 RepID=A0ACC0XTT5_9ROSI|nr:hypothetical protein Pint_08857 [Pistacia integerrima]